MTTSDMIRELCDRMNISLAELCRRIGQTPQNFNKKLQRGTVSSEEMAKIAEAAICGLERTQMRFRADALRFATDALKRHGIIVSFEAL